MGESWLVVALLGVVSLCLLILTWTFFSTAQEFRRTLQRVNTMLPACDQTLHEVQHLFHQMRGLLTRTRRATNQIDLVIRTACQGALDAFEHLGSLRTQARRLWVEHFGNGTRGGPRRRPRVGEQRRGRG